MRDRQGKLLARWDSRSAHDLWVDSQDDVYLAFTGAENVDKYIRQASGEKLHMPAGSSETISPHH